MLYIDFALGHRYVFMEGGARVNECTFFTNLTVKIIFVCLTKDSQYFSNNVAIVFEMYAENVR